MKRLFFATICAAAMLTTSCEKSFDDVAMGGDKTATLSVNIDLPEMSTRAFADGTSATELQYAVYEVTDEGLNKIKADGYYGEKEMTNLSATLSFTLLKDHTYGLVFWAGAPEKDGWESPYTVTFTDTGATMSYKEESTLIANSDNFDAFYAYKTVKVTGDRQISAQLYRPFAQINIGTDDFDKAKKLDIDVESITSYVQVPVAGSLNLVTGEVDATESAGTVKFDWSAVPKDETYPVAGCNYLAMAYVLVGKEQATIDIEFGFNAGGVESTRKVGSVPVQRNYRTNIYGSLLTSNLGVNVEIEPDTDGDKKVMLKWDGTTTNKPEYDEETSTYTVSGADELAWLASQENTDYANQTIVLENNLDLDGKEFPAFAASAIRSGSASSGTSFKGKFDGKGKTISNFKLKGNYVEDDVVYGFFTSVEGKDAEVKNVTFESVEIEGGEQAGVVGIVSNGATVDGVVVKSGKISSQKATGGVVGRVLMNGTVKNCENYAAVESKKTNAGGIIGAAYYTDDDSAMTISGCNNYGVVTAATAGAGGIVGLNCSNVNNCNNYGAVTGGTTSTGGIVGEQKSAGSVKNCTNYADVVGGTGYGTGGVVGWVRYEASDAYKKLEPIVVSGCTNEGEHITGASGVGSIVGMWYSDGECTGNTNYAETITASGFVASIVGGTQWIEIASNGTKDYGDLKLKVTNNTTYTADENITGGSKGKFIYDNTSGSHTVIQGNVEGTATTVSNSEGLKSALESAEDNAYIKLKKGTYEPFAYKSNNNFTTQNVTIDCGGAVFTGDESSLNFNETTTIKNATFKNYDKKHTANNVNSACGAYGYTCGNFENCVFEGESGFRYMTISGNTTFKNCEFIASNEHAAHVDSATGDFTVTFDNCTASGYCPLGSSSLTFVIKDCTFSTNEAVFGGVGLRRPTTLTNCKFNVGCQYDHDEVAVKDAAYAYVFSGCTVNGAALTTADLTVDKDNTSVTIDNVQSTLNKTTPTKTRPANN